MGCVSLLIAAWLPTEGRKSCLRSFSRLARWRFAPHRYPSWQGIQRKGVDIVDRVIWIGGRVARRTVDDLACTS